ncbi:MAG: restriction endonuclease subunit S [Microcystis sp.]|jgi:type I restriction enzyme S subunit|uniref:restriction endonuclease subunit S n=2 Tax=Microcystis sp. TaxID=1127 RepID=UPI00391DFE73
MMTKKWQPYPTYKDSGVEWLGAIPEHWKVKKLKYLAKINLSNVDKKSNENEDTVKLCNYVDVYYNDYITKEIDFLIATASHEQKQKFALKKGDVLLTKDSETWDDIAVPACVANDLDNVICGYHLAHIRPYQDRAIGEYIFRSISSTRLKEQFWVAANGVTRFGISKSSISDALLLEPPVSEQQKIAEFLDQETGKIDKLITKKERLIKLLKEKRTALISHAVTKGLNPDVPMKDSGVEWLGEIPEHWESLPAFSVVREQNISNKGMLEINLLSLSYGNIIRKDIDTDYGLLPESFETYQIVNRGNIIMRLTDLQNDKRSLRVGLVKERGIITSAYLCLDTRQLISEYAYYLLHSYDITKVFYNMGAGVRQTMKFVDLRRLPILVPDLQEQQKIAQFLDRETGKIDNLITKTRTSIDHLKEYRTALISAAVTGKIDVREH